jgi:hypothetical protein
MPMARPKRTRVLLRPDLADRLQAESDARMIGAVVLLDRAVEDYLDRLVPLDEVLARYPDSAQAEARNRGRTDLGDGRCTNHPTRCMIPGCDHTTLTQHLLDTERFGHDLVENWCPTACHHAQG